MQWNAQVWSMTWMQQAKAGTLIIWALQEFAERHKADRAVPRCFVLSSQ